MTLADRLIDIVGRIIDKLEEKHIETRVYCQNCSEDLTKSGGYLTEKAAIYCIRDVNEEQCLNVFRYKCKGGIVSIVNSGDLERVIEEKSLIYYHKPRYHILGNNTLH